MKEVINILSEMGAANIVFDECEAGSYSSYLTFEFGGKEVSICAEWFNTEQAGLSGYVDTIQNNNEVS